MRREVLLLIARQFGLSVFKSKSIYLLLALVAVLLFFSSVSGFKYHQQNKFREAHQHIARESWESNPDKHPHRMAHFGTFAFRLKHPLSIFDFGLESFTGNAIFLEAHRQNTTNFSEASFSTALIRFGELSMGMILQTIFPLLIFFIGYALIVSDKENGTLKILLTQGASWKEILYGRSLGLLGLSMLFYLPFILVTCITLSLYIEVSADVWFRLILLFCTYFFYLVIISLITTLISIRSKTSKAALVKLLGIWLLLVVLLPKTSQALGAYFYPTPSKLAFRDAIEDDVVQFGDSHDQNDPHYKHLKDSILQAYHVTSVKELPFNYGGFQMFEGEKISANIYRHHHDKLLEQYQKQNIFTKSLAVFNPYLGMKNLSMSLCGTDLATYISFQKAAEDYRYALAQHMNTLQMKHIKANVSSSEGKINVVSREEWKAFPDFSYHDQPITSVLKNNIITIGSIMFWLVCLLGVINYWSKKASVF